MAHKRKRIFDGLYAQLEETDGNVVLFSARGEPSVIFEITNPVQQLCTDAQQYMLFHDVLSNILRLSVRDMHCRSRIFCADRHITMTCRTMRSS